MLTGGYVFSVLFNAPWFSTGLTVPIKESSSSDDNYLYVTANTTFDKQQNSNNKIENVETNCFIFKIFEINY